MVWIDVAFIAVIALSTLFALMRGFVRESVSLLGWLIAFWAAFTYYEVAATWIPADIITSDTLRLAAGFVGVFVGVLIVSGIINTILGKIVDATGMGAFDRLLSIFFGAARGVAIVVAVILLIKLTPLSNLSWWKDSEVIPALQPITDIAARHAQELFEKNWETGKSSAEQTEGTTEEGVKNIELPPETKQ